MNPWLLDRHFFTRHFPLELCLSHSITHVYAHWEQTDKPPRPHRVKVIVFIIQQ